MDVKQPDNHEAKGRISSVAVLDWRQMKSAEELRNIGGISSVGTILLSDAFQGTLAGIPMKAVGSIITLPEASKVNLIGGTMRLGGEFLEKPGADGSDILLVTGELLITSPPAKFGYKQLIVAGQLFIPRGSESVLTPYITQSSGDIIPYDPRNPRWFMGQGRFGREFFEYLKEPVTLILMGEYVIEADVTSGLLREKVSEIIQMGVLKAADKKLVPVLMALSVGQMSTIQVSGQLEGESQ
ncbi:hypothetical protein PV433_16815 [Paenibacillus sp. GYB004]|uniref:hypothetical protein n=1 Tax=Paenibacillus sp. GYB004 TaxID=2994393 RepID=UPI002F962898